LRDRPAEARGGLPVDGQAFMRSDCLDREVREGAVPLRMRAAYQPTRLYCVGKVMAVGNIDNSAGM